MRILTTLAALGLCSCFSPDEQDGVIHCGAVPPSCPPGFVCQADGFCWRPEDVADAGLPDAKKDHGREER